MTVTLNEDARRFETSVDGETAFLTFMRRGDTMVLVHTEVPEALEGRGVGSEVVRAALDYVRTNNLKVVPQCPFVKAYLDRHPEAAEGLTII